MDEYRPGQRPQGRQVHSNSGKGIQFLASAEEQLLQSICAHEPLPEVLNKICSALDCQIGNVVSFISLRGHDASKRAGVAMNAARFGLHIFSTESVVGENNELLGFLVTYSCIPRNPSASEFQWIERAKCLAAIAIKRGIEAGLHTNGPIEEDPPMRANGRIASTYVG